MFNTVVWITGMPRSGTNWIAQIFASSPAVRLKHCPLFSYEFKNILNEKSSAQDWDKLFKDVYLTKSEYLDQEYLRKDGLVPSFKNELAFPPYLAIKSNRYHNLTETILEKHNTIRFVGIIRHPCATIHSWLSNPMEFPEGADPLKEWQTGSCRKNGPGEFWGFKDWKKVTKLFLRLEKKYEDRFLLVRYENFITEKMRLTRKLFNSFDIPFDDQTIDFIDRSNKVHHANPRSVYKSPKVKDRWKTELIQVIADEIQSDLEGTELEQFIQGY